MYIWLEFTIFTYFAESYQKDKMLLIRMQWTLYIYIFTLKVYSIKNGSDLG